MTQQRIAVERNATVFTLPWIIGKEAGLFAEEGIDVALVTAGSYLLKAERPLTDPGQVSPMAGQSAFASGEVGVFQA